MSDENSKKRQRLLIAAAAAAADNVDHQRRADAKLARDEQHSDSVAPSEAGPARSSGTTTSDLRWDDLPSEAFQYVLSFLDFTNRQRLTTTNQRGLQEVEKYSKKLCERIREEHAVDETFDARVRDQSTIRTARVKPVYIPWRYRAVASLKKHLYRIDLSRRYNFQRPTPELQLSPSEHRLAMSESIFSGRVDVVDLSTRRLTTSMDQVCSPIILDDNRIVSFSPADNSLRVWEEDSETGAWNDEIIPASDARGGLITNVARTTRSGEDTIFASTVQDFTDRRRPGQLILHSMSTMGNFTVEGIFKGHFTSIKCLFVAEAGNQKWILFAANESPENVREPGLYIYNAETKQKSQYLAGYCYYQLVQASDCPRTFFYQRRDRVVKLELGENGQVSERFSFYAHGWEAIIAASKKRVLVINADKVDIFDAITGELDRTLHPSLQQGSRGVISNTRNELFALETNNSLTPEARTTVCAFCLDEPRM